MDALKVSDLLGLEEYHRQRAEFRAKVIEHKKHRQVPLGRNATLYFEDRLTIQYQVQEMLRIERIFETEAIEEELSAYNPLIPDGSNFKATFMIEYPDVEERRRALEKLAEIEHRIHLEVEGVGRVTAVADEDLERSERGKTSAVHFMRFELTPEMKQAIKSGRPFRIFSDHPEYLEEAVVTGAVAASLANDLD